MQLVIFDVDGTLTRTNAVDHECFLAALRAELALDVGDVDWAGFTHVTDHGVVHELCERALGRAPTEDEHARLVDGFMARLAAAYQRDAARFDPVPGSPSAFEHARERHAVAIATGCWRRSACFKLDRVRIDHATTPAGFSEDGPARESILRAATERALAAHALARFDRIVSVGDATWDVRAAQRLGLAFVGIGKGARAEKLRAAGAATVLPDYADLAAFESALATAQSPGFQGT